MDIRLFFIALVLTSLAIVMADDGQETGYGLGNFGDKRLANMAGDNEHSGKFRMMMAKNQGSKKEQGGKIGIKMAGKTEDSMDGMMEKVKSLMEDMKNDQNKKHGQKSDQRMKRLEERLAHLEQMADNGTSGKSKKTPKGGKK